MDEPTLREGLQRQETRWQGC